MRLQAGVKRAKPLCFATIGHVTVRMNQVWETGPPNKPIGTQADDARAKGLNNLKPGSKVRNQPFAPTLKQEKTV